ncbi:MAG: putative ral secretion pathway protein (Type traffic warden ATPase) [Nitrospirae bacterium]|nr:putative ral secretion pathway protein (Type traffic warden ATPase) [Nitrospirota bacterium]
MSMRKKIGEILLDAGNITSEGIIRTLEVQKAEGMKRRFCEILMDEGISEEDIFRALSAQFQMPLLDMKDFPETLPIEKISFGFLEENLILPLELKANVLKIAVGDPTNIEGLESIKASYDYDLSVVLAKKSEIAQHLKLLHGSRSAVMQRLIEDTAEDELSGTDLTGEISHLRDLAQEKGIIQLVNLLMSNAVKDRASDIHVEPGEIGVRVRYRIDGVLYEKETLPVRMYSAVTSRIKLLSQMNIAERRLPQDGRIKVTVAEKAIDIRVSTIPTIYGESIVMRLLDKETSFITLEDIGFDRTLLDIYEDVILKPYGMILITGPTGSGKSTTLYASLAKINSPEKKIITVEEPVEYLMQGITQIQVRPKIGLTFANGLRHIVRQDPDVIMVGEIRDMETASIGIHASLTGHLLFSTLHTNDAPGAITRLMDMGVENYLVASTLICVMAQRLVRRLCEHCKVKQDVSADILKKFNSSVKEVWIGTGCDYCSGTGYRGRIGIFEVLPVGDEIRELIMRRSTVKEIKDKAIALGMRTLREDGIEKVKRGVTTIDEVLRVTQVEL